MRAAAALSSVSPPSSIHLSPAIPFPHRPEQKKAARSIRSSRQVRFDEFEGASDQDVPPPAATPPEHAGGANANGDRAGRALLVGAAHVVEGRAHSATS